VALPELITTVRRQPSMLLGSALVGLVVLAAVAAPALARHPYDRGRLQDRLQGPSVQHWLGTDELGRDLFSRIVYGARVALGVGLGATALAILLATVVAVPSSSRRGALDLLVQRMVETALAFPPLLLVLTVAGLIPPASGDVRMVFVTISPAVLRAIVIALVLGVQLSFMPMRVLRSAVLMVRTAPYIEAARCLGASEARVFLRHVLPNVAPMIVALATIQFGAAVLAEAALAFLGWGIPPPVPSWGQMLGGPARSYLVQHPALSLWPGLAITATVLGSSLLGDGLRDLLDPRRTR
jgi:peptide/nickel transport system permease protein